MPSQVYQIMDLYPPSSLGSCTDVAGPSPRRASTARSALTPSARVSAVRPTGNCALGAWPSCRAAGRVQQAAVEGGPGPAEHAAARPTRRRWARSTPAHSVGSRRSAGGKSAAARGGGKHGRTAGGGGGMGPVPTRRARASQTASPTAGGTSSAASCGSQAQMQSL